MAIYKKIISSIITCSLAVSIPYAAMAEKLNYVETTDAVYDEHMKVSDFCEKTNVAAVYTDGKYGFIYADGTKITEPIFSEADEPLVFDEDTALLLAADEHEKWGAVDLNGKVKVKFEYEALTYLDEKRLAAQKNGKWGIIDYNGKKTVDFKYDFISSFFDKGESGESAYSSNSIKNLTINDMYCAVENGKYGIINSKGITVLPFEYLLIGYEFYSGRCCVKTADNTFGFIDKTGKLVISPIKVYGYYNEDYSPNFTNGVLICHDSKDESKAIDINGNVLFDLDFRVGDFYDGLAPFKDSSTDKYGYVNKKGEIAIGAIYDEAGEFCDGIAIIEKNEKSGYINKNGSEIIAPQYDYADNFHNGIATVKLNDKYGAIDMENKVVIPFVYDSLGSFDDGYVTAEKDGKCGIIDSGNNIIVPIEYDGIHCWPYVDKKGFYGIYDCELEYPETKSGFFKSTTDNTIVMHINSSVMRVNGEDAEIDPGRGTAAVIKDSRTLVPIRAIIESFGGSADWNGDENKVTLKLGKNKLEMTVNSNDIKVNSKKATIDVAPTIINDRTMIPIRVLEKLGCSIAWNSADQRIFVTYYK